VTALWVLLALVALLALIGLGGALMLLTAEVATLVAATQAGVVISQQNADTSKRMADALERPRPQTVFVETGAGSSRH
jgi:hypothetical protein